MTDDPNASGDADARPVAYPAQLAWRQRNPVARAAHLKIGRARRRGEVVPEVCAWPGCFRTDTEAHHPDYSRPLDVKWFCRRHHKAEHKRIKCEAIGAPDP